MLREEMLPTGHPNWLIIVILMSLGAYASSRLFFPRYWRRFNQAMIYPIEADKLLFEKNTNLYQYSLLLNFLAMLAVSLFLYFISPHHATILNSLSEPVSFAFILMMVLFLSILKYAGTLFLGWIFNVGEVSIQFNHIWLIHLKVFGFIMLIWSVLAGFLPPGLLMIAYWGGVITFIIMMIFNNIRGAALLLRNGISLFYGILYLCTLEVLPVIMIIRLIKT